MISFSNLGSGHHQEYDKVADAVRLIHEREPELAVDGEMQADAAVEMDKLQEIYDFSNLKEAANILAFGNLTAVNTAYKLLDRLGGAEVIGPIRLGMARPIHLIQRGCAGQDVLNLATIASVDAQAKSPRAQ